MNVRSMHVLPRVVDAELMQSELNLDFIKFTNDPSRCELSSRARFFKFCFVLSARVAGHFEIFVCTFCTCSGTFRNFFHFFFTKSYTVLTNMTNSVFYSTKCII